MKVYLSPRRLSLFKECKRCFFDETFLRLKRPRGAYPTLPGAVDEAMKAYCDDLRLSGDMPIQLKGFVDGMQLLEDQSAINRMRFWKDGLSVSFDRTKEYNGKEIRHEYMVQGSIDELLFDPDTDTFAIPDFKTRKSKPDEGYSKEYYQTSMDTYAWLLSEMGLEPNGVALLWYLWPLKVSSVDAENISIGFGSSVQQLEVDGKETRAMLEEIVEMTPKDGMVKANYESYRPNVNPECEYCNYKRQR